MARTASFAVAFAAGLLAVCAAAALSRDGAVIVDSGSTNTAGYSMKVWSDRTAVVTLQNHLGEEQTSPKSFTVPQDVATKFFADLKAARDGQASGEHCMKSASFGTTTRVQWHGWTSPDLDCPGNNPLTLALVRDVNALRAAGGVGTVPLRHMPVEPPRLQTSPQPSPSET